MTVAFLRFAGTDELIEREGLEATADALRGAGHRRAGRRRPATRSASWSTDVDDGGGKLLLTAGAPRDHRRRRGAHAAGAARDRSTRGRAAAGAHRRQPRQRVRRRHRPALPAHLQRDGRRGEPRCARHGEGAGRGALLDRRACSTARRRTSARPRWSRSASRARPSRCQAWSVGRPVSARRGPRSPSASRWSGASARSRRSPAALDDARAGSGRLVEIVGEAGIGKTAARRTSCTSAPRDLARAARDREAFTRIDAVRRLARAAARGARRRLGGQRRRSCSRGSPACVERAARPSCGRGCRCWRCRSTSTRRARPEVDALAPEFRRARLHESVIAFLRALLDRPTLIECDDAQYLDEASAELFAAIAREVETMPWLVCSSRREGGRRLRGAASARGRADRARPARASPTPARSPRRRPTPRRSTRTLLDARGRALRRQPAVPARPPAGGGGRRRRASCPESLEAAAMARIDRLDPEDRTIIRRASVLGLSFHPRFLLEVLGDDVPPPTRAHVECACEPFFQDDGDGYLRFRRVDRARRRLRRAALPHATRAARRGRAADGARVRRHARRGRRPAVAALPSAPGSTSARGGTRARPRTGARNAAPSRRRPTSTAARSTPRAASSSTSGELAGRLGGRSARRRRAPARCAGRRRLQPRAPAAARGPGALGRAHAPHGACATSASGARARRSAGRGAACARSTGSRARAAARARRADHDARRGAPPAGPRRRGRAPVPRGTRRRGSGGRRRAGGPRLVHPGLGALRPGAPRGGRALRARARDLRARRRPRASGRRAEQPRHVRLLGGPLAARRRALRARGRGERARRRRLGRGLRRLQHRRAPLRPGRLRRRRGAPAPRAPGLARDRGRRTASRSPLRCSAGWRRATAAPPRRSS